ncbi:Hint domain-containing protein [Actinosynnema sp. NPDC023587]|uniref:Hint domain-containing protein n=1 Tax=Actinosynnema sp. NPDC023587 TaxID=3154695 RepID=UPI0033C36BD6
MSWAATVPFVGIPFAAMDCAKYAQDGDTAGMVGACMGVMPGVELGGKLGAAAAKALPSGRVSTLESGMSPKLVKYRNSFTGDTRVLMADGSTKRIDEIKAGDKVTNSEPEETDTEQHAVLAVHVTDADADYVDLTVSTPDGGAHVLCTRWRDTDLGSQLWDWAGWSN